MVGKQPCPDGDDDIDILGCLPDRPFTHKKLYSWAYHKWEVLGKKLGTKGEALKKQCREKAKKAVVVYAAAIQVSC